MFKAWIKLQRKMDPEAERFLRYLTLLRKSLASMNKHNTYSRGRSEVAEVQELLDEAEKIEKELEL